MFLRQKKNRKKISKKIKVTETSHYQFPIKIYSRTGAGYALHDRVG